MKKNEYASIQLRLQRQMEKRFIGSVYRALKAQISSFTSDVRRGGLSYGISRLKSRAIDPVMSKTIERIHKQAGLFEARKVRRKIGQEKGYESEIQLKAGFGFNERMTREIQEYFRIFLLEKAVLPISSTTRARINTVLDEAIEKGWSVDEILKHLEGEMFGNMTRRRVRMIVRTEVVRASNFGGMAAAFDSEYEMVKTWNEVKDPRTRRSHRHSTGVGGQTRGLLEAYSNGGQFPGDPDLPGKETINCRCKQTYRIKRDADGVPIKKKPVFVNAPRESLANILAFGIGVGIESLINEFGDV